MCIYEEPVQCDGLLLKNVMKTMCESIQGEITGALCVLLLIKKKNGTVWWHVYNKSVMALVSLVHYVWIDQRYSVMALIQKVWWHLFAFEKEVQCDGTST